MRRKIGPHCLGWTTDAARLGRSGVAVAKFAGLFDGAAELAALPLEMRPRLMIGRVVEEEFGIAERMGNDAATGGTIAVEYARSYFARYLEKPIHDQPAINAWEGPNEPTAQSADGMRWYADFLYELARLIRAVGKTAVIGGWSVGSPDYPYWSYYGRALLAVRDHGAVLSRHSYAGPDQSTWPFLLLRHRRDNEIFTAMGYPDLPVVLTECGADDAPFGNPPGKAWKDLYGTDGARYAREILVPLELELRKDDYVIGATLFTYGPASWWARHNVDGAGVTDALLALPAPEEDEVDTKSLIAAIEAHRLGVMDDLTNVINHGVEMGKLVEQLSHLPDEPPPVPWWELLQEPLPGAPKAKIYAVKDHRSMSATVPVYKSGAADKPPSFLDTDTRVKKPGESVEVWHAVVPGSKWICTFDGPSVGIAGLVLWMWAEDVAKDKPV